MEIRKQHPFAEICPERGVEKYPDGSPRAATNKNKHGGKSKFFVKHRKMCKKALKKGSRCDIKFHMYN